MATPTKTVKVHIGNRTYNLRYSNLSFVLLEQESGKTLQEHQQATQRGSALSISWLLWAGVVHADESIPFRTIAESMEFQKYGEYAEAIGKALSIAIGDDDAAPEGNAQGDD